MTQAPSNRRRVELLAAALAAGPAAPRQAVWESIERQVHVPSTGFSLAPKPARSPLIRVAVLLLLVGGGAFGGYAVLSRMPKAASPAPLMRVATTPPGQRASFRLPDGTKVILGVASTLRHPVTFAPGRREVEVEGEAYFEVAHEAGRAFVVRAGDIIAEDLGTEFIVRSYPEERGARVVVREGKVALHRASSPGAAGGRVVQAGQLGRLAGDGTPVVETADTSAYFAWTDGRLVLDGVPLRDALPQLSRWFDLDFRLSYSTLGSVPLTTTLKTQPSPDVLNLLAASLGMRQVRQGRTVTFYPAAGVR